MSSENSALIALSELKNLESSRKQKLADNKAAEVQAESDRIAAEAAAQQAAEDQARAEQQAQAAAEAAENEAREREERIRVQEAEAHAKAEAERQLKEEQMRLDAQVRMEEKKAKPLWLYGALAALVIAMIVGGIMVYKSNQATADEQAARDAKRDQELAALQDQFKKQTAEMNAQRDKLAADLAAATTDAQREAIKRQQAELAAKQAELAAQEAEAATPTKKKRTGGSGKKKATDGNDKPSVAAPDVTKKRKKKISLGTGDDPLG